MFRTAQSIKEQNIRQLGEREGGRGVDERADTGKEEICDDAAHVSVFLSAPMHAECL